MNKSVKADCVVKLVVKRQSMVNCFFKKNTTTASVLIENNIMMRHRSLATDWLVQNNNNSQTKNCQHEPDFRLNYEVNQNSICVFVTTRDTFHITYKIL